jgi:toxin ParE1/3/4
VRVRLTRSAEQDLVAIADWIRRDNPLRAITFAEELHARCLSLAQRPKRFPIARKIEGVLIRKLGYRDYLIFYVVGAETVDVVRILHGARHWPSLLGEEG